MNIAFIFKIVLLIISAIAVIHSLMEVAKKKSKFQIYPDSMKKNLYSQIRLMAILNYLSVILIFTACFLLQSKFYYVLIILPTIISLTSMEFIYEDFHMFEEEEKKRR